MQKHIRVAYADATDRQLLLHVVDRLISLETQLLQMEKTMSDLSASVDALKGAVDGVAQRLLPQISVLEAALVAAQADDANAAVALADAVAASTAIRVEVDRLNALGASPATPVDPAAPNADVVPVVDVPSEPTV